MTIKRELFPSGAPWEPIYGYSRAVRMGPLLAVSGTVAVADDGDIVGRGDAYAQTRRCIEIIRTALEAAGASLDDVIRTRAYVTDIEQWEEVARGHQESFGEIRPAATMVEVSRLIDPALLVEIEADAVVAVD